MTAIEEQTGTAGRGKSTRDSSRLSVGAATRALPLPHLPYADAVHVELVAAGLEPDRIDAGIRREPGGPRELYLTAVWEAEHPDLHGDLWPEGMTVSWSHLTGWSTHDGDTVRALVDVDAIAPPALIADAALHLAVHGLHVTWVPPVGGRWQHAPALDAALAAYPAREVEW
ncbi:hypothetical protein [Streptomyces sp. NPDC057877]|uniref:hypothetical protein n=1 Tax=Streptomyces sp. NPDC057877 TaxID=3346269 RepID=UPI00368159B1